MCLIVFAYRQHSQYPLILVANRDEFYQRPSAAAHYWQDQTGVYAGRDLEQLGTWLGINTRNRHFAAVTNFREVLSPTPQNTNFTSRGFLVRDFLRSSQNNDNDSDGIRIEDYLQQLQNQREAFQGYNLLLWQQQRLFYYSNKLNFPASNENNDLQDKLETDGSLKPGCYGLSNGLLDTPWPKVLRAKANLQMLLDSELPLTTESLQQVLLNRDIVPDHKLPDTGVGLDTERLLSPCFIHSEHYGTRTTTALLVNQQGDFEMLETSWDENGEAYEQRYLKND